MKLAIVILVLTSCVYGKEERKAHKKRYLQEFGYGYFQPPSISANNIPNNIRIITLPSNYLAIVQATNHANNQYVSQAHSANVQSLPNTITIPITSNNNAIAQAINYANNQYVSQAQSLPNSITIPIASNNNYPVANLPNQAYASNLVQNAGPIIALQLINGRPNNAPTYSPSPLFPSNLPQRYIAIPIPQRQFPPQINYAVSNLPTNDYGQQANGQQTNGQQMFGVPIITQIQQHQGGQIENLSQQPVQNPIRIIVENPPPNDGNGNVSNDINSQAVIIESANENKNENTSPPQKIYLPPHDDTQNNRRRSTSTYEYSPQK